MGNDKEVTNFVGKRQRDFFPGSGSSPQLRDKMAHKNISCFQAFPVSGYQVRLSCSVQQSYTTN